MCHCLPCTRGKVRAKHIRAVDLMNLKGLPPHIFSATDVHVCESTVFCLAGRTIVLIRSICTVFRNTSRRVGGSTAFFVSISCLYISFFHWKDVAQTCMSFIRETIARYLQKRRSCTPGVGCVTALSCVGSTGAGTHQRTYSFPLSESGPHTPWESRRGSTSRTGKRTACNINTCSRYHAPSLRVARRVY